MSTRKKIYVVLSVLVIVLVLGASFGYITATGGSSNNNTITVADFNVKLYPDITSVQIGENVNGNYVTYPMSDSEGLNNTPVTFSIVNEGDIIASYKVSLIDKDVVSTLRNTDVRYRLKKKVGNDAQQVLEITTLTDTGLIDEGTIESGTTITYELVLWVSHSSTAAGATWKKSVLVEGMQIPNIVNGEYSDLSGANYPELADNMIPVYYDETTQTWRKASLKNTKNTYQWYDYNSGKWANAVTVYENSSATTLTIADGSTTSCSGATCTRDDYLNAAEGTIIPMNDITSMWVWIPRFKYMIFNGNNETAEEQIINVTFEHGKETTGTVACNFENNIESCSDSSSIINGKSTYTHPAFSFDNQELTGFWMAKFEMSTDDATCNTTSNETNCNKTNLNILVKPNLSSLRNETISTLFTNVRRMELYGNIHGFYQSAGVTYNTTGEITDDINNLNLHLIKNMEWGAVAYLSQSKYGKRGNTDYTGNNLEVYINNNSNYLTGYSGGAYNSEASSSETYTYNNSTYGIGASTTGNVYGVYDMNGGAGEYVMGNQVDSNGNFTASSSGNWSPNSKYYDKYQYNEDSTSYSKGRFGDNIKEVSSWYNDTRTALDATNSWFIRGGNSSGTNSSGIFASSSGTGGATATISSRPVLTVSREMPWEVEQNNNNQEVENNEEIDNNE